MDSAVTVHGVHIMRLWQK